MRSPSSSLPVASFLALAHVLAACGATDHGSVEPDPTPSATAAGSASSDAPARVPVAAPSGGATGGSSAASPDASGAVVVRATPLGGASVAPVVEARSAIELRGTLRVERLEAGAFTAIDVRGLSLRPGCDAPAPSACVSLREGGALEPPAWNGTRERGQCGCDGACRRVEPGEYRFVVESCDGRAIASAPFRYAP